MYGALTGLSKTETAEKLGSELVQEWRGSLRTRPPPVELNSPYWPGRDRKYADLTPEQLPRTESLMDCMERTFPLWEERILQEIKNGRNVLVVAHANTLRGLVKIIDNIGDDEIQDVAIPTGIPIVYNFGKDMKPILPDTEIGTAAQEHMTGVFLEKPGLLREALLRETEWAEQVPGYSSTLSRVKTPMSSLERSLYKLQAERELGEWAGQFIDPSKMTDDGNDGNMQKLMDEIWAKGIKELNNLTRMLQPSMRLHAWMP
jgi:broad specificity phosphatase PhoE